jgi:murein DD-endopeptidase MepM/ murein hydrolase activator NlpD
MKKYLLFIPVFLATLHTVSAGSFVYPIDQIAKPACRYSAWSTLDDGCKMTLPRITGADYTKFKDDKVYRRIYSVLWGATYAYGWDVGYGSHLGVDIATAQGTPVRSIGDGEVMSAGWQSGWGNTISIKHTLTDGIYSNYAHLLKTSVVKGARLKAGDSIGEVGNTGNSYGNHLHFQIDSTNQAHPYYYVTCAK